MKSTPFPEVIKGPGTVFPPFIFDSSDGYSDGLSHGYNDGLIARFGFDFSTDGCSDGVFLLLE